MQNAKVKFIKNITKTLSDRNTGEILKQTKSSNDIEDAFLNACMRAATSGHFYPSSLGDPPAAYIRYIKFDFGGGDPSFMWSLRPSNDNLGLDVVSGGTGLVNNTVWRGYLEPDSTVTVAELALIYHDGASIEFIYATDPDGQEVTSAQRYTIDWEIAAVRCDEISP